MAFPADERPLEERFADALVRMRGRMATREELPGVLTELEVRTAVVTDEALVPDGIERLPLERARGRRRRVHAGAGGVRGDRDGRARAVAQRDADGQPAAARARRRRAARRAGGDARATCSETSPRVFPDGLPSAFALATGPSKSADIDGKVVYGVHGPLAVVAVLV